MINVNKITSTLAKLQPDSELQQYVQMHKNDPYIVALGMLESNRRKELRDADQAANSDAQEQPTVVDQMVAQMAPQQMPEDQGIGQLPAGDMNFANGGIIAFADGGGVERYQSQGLVRLPNEDFATYRRRVFDAEMQAQQDRNTAEAQAREAERQRMLGARGEDTMVPPSPFFERAPMAFNSAQTAGTQPAAKPAASVASPTDPNFRRQTDPRLLGTSAVPSTTPLLTSGPGSAPGPTTNNKAAAPAAPPGPTQSSEAGIEALQKKYFDPLDQEIGGLRNARVGLASGIAELANNNLAATKADIEKRGDVYKGREERLTKQEKGLEGMNDKYMGLALLQAGAAMMTTPGGISMALGKGIDVGSKQYAVGMEKINAAKEKFAEARDRLDDLRINRDDMNAKDIRAAEKEVREAQLKGQELFYNGLVSDLGIKQKNVTAIFGAAADDLKTTRQIEAERANTLTRERGATARANAFTPDMREAMLLGTGTTPEEKYLSGLKVKKDLMGDKQGTQLFKMFLEENGRREKNMEQPLTLDQFRRQSAAFFAPPAPVDTGKPTRP